MEGEGQVRSLHSQPLPPSPSSQPWPQWGKVGVEVGVTWTLGEVLTISGSSIFAFGVGGLYEGGPSRL